MADSRLVNRNITAGVGRTSMRLEPEVWDALREVCIREGLELRELIKEVEKSAVPGGRTSAVRVHVLQYFRAAATDGGHVQAGHGTKTVSGGPIRLPNEILAAADVVDDPPKIEAITALDTALLDTAVPAQKALDTALLDVTVPAQLDS